MIRALLVVAVLAGCGGSAVAVGQAGLAGELQAAGMTVSGSEAVSSSGRTVVVFDDQGVTVVASRSADERAALDVVAEHFGITDELADWIDHETAGGAAYPIAEGTARILVDDRTVKLDIAYSRETELASDHRWLGLARRVTEGE